MKKFVIGFLLGSLIFGGIAIAREKIVDFSEASIPILNNLLNEIWNAIGNKGDVVIKDDTPSQEFHDRDNNKAFMFHYDSGAKEDWVFALYYGQDYEGSDFNIDSAYRKPFLGFGSTGGVFMPYIKTGATQVAAGAVKSEIWADSDIEYTLKLGQ